MARTIASLTLSVLMALLSACSATHAAGGAKPAGRHSAAPPGSWSVVAIGDSVPAGTACDCEPYPELSAADLSRSGGPVVTVHNDAVAGFTTPDVLLQLAEDQGVIDDVKAARLVEVQVGANDVAYSAACGEVAGCYLPLVPEVRANLKAIVSRVHQIAADHPVDVVLLDYWSVWLGGQYAAQEGPVYVDAADTVTDEINAAVREVAVETCSG